MVEDYVESLSIQTETHSELHIECANLVQKEHNARVWRCSILDTRELVGAKSDAGLRQPKALATFTHYRQKGTQKYKAMSI